MWRSIGVTNGYGAQMQVGQVYSRKPHSLSGLKKLDEFGSFVDTSGLH